MNIKLDENLPESLVSKLEDSRHLGMTSIQCRLSTWRDETTRSGEQHKQLAAFRSRRIWISPTCAVSNLGLTPDCYWCASHGPAGMPWHPGWPCCSQPSKSISGEGAWSSQPSIRCESGGLREPPQFRCSGAKLAVSSPVMPDQQSSGPKGCHPD